jgi:hypothetical protein
MRRGWRRSGGPRRWRRRSRGPGRWRRGSRGGRSRARRRSLRRLLWLSFFFLGLGHDLRRGLRVRWRGDQLRRRKSGRGKQQQAKVCHDGLDPRKILGRKAWQASLATRRGDQRIDVRPDCGGTQRRTCIYFSMRKAPIRSCSLRIQGMLSNRHFTLSPQRIRCTRIQIGPGTYWTVHSVGRGRGRARTFRSSHRQFLRRAARQFVGLWRLAGLPHRRRHLGPRVAGRAFLRRLGRIARRRRRDFGRIDRHLLLSLRKRNLVRQRRGGGKVPGRLSYPRSNSVLLRVLPASA